MARFSTLTAERIAELTRRGTSGGVDLTEYKDAVARAFSDTGWGEITLDPSEPVRAIKRRTTVAGKEIGKIVKWNRRSTPTQLIYQVFAVGNAPKRRTRAVKRK